MGGADTAGKAHRLTFGHEIRQGRIDIRKTKSITECQRALWKNALSRGNHVGDLTEHDPKRQRRRGHKGRSVQRSAKGFAEFSVRYRLRSCAVDRTYSPAALHGQAETPFQIRVAAP